VTLGGCQEQPPAIEPTPTPTPTSYSVESTSSILCPTDPIPPGGWSFNLPKSLAATLKGERLHVNASVRTSISDIQRIEINVIPDQEDLSFNWSSDESFAVAQHGHYIRYVVNGNQTLHRDHTPGAYEERLLALSALSLLNFVDELVISYTDLPPVNETLQALRLAEASGDSSIECNDNGSRVETVYTISSDYYDAKAVFVEGNVTSWFIFDKLAGRVTDVKMDRDAHVLINPALNRTSFLLDDSAIVYDEDGYPFWAITEDSWSVPIGEFEVHNFPYIDCTEVETQRVPLKVGYTTFGKNDFEFFDEDGDGMMGPGDRYELYEGESCRYIRLYDLWSGSYVRVA
jgi:hypothetical protein